MLYSSSRRGYGLARKRRRVELGVSRQTLTNYPPSKKNCDRNYSKANKIPDSTMQNMLTR